MKWCLSYSKEMFEQLYTFRTFKLLFTVIEHLHSQSFNIHPEWKLWQKLTPSNLEILENAFVITGILKYWWALPFFKKMIVNYSDSVTLGPAQAKALTEEDVHNWKRHLRSAKSAESLFSLINSPSSHGGGSLGSRASHVSSDTANGDILESSSVGAHSKLGIYS